MFIRLTVNISNMPPLQTADQKQAAERAAASLGFGGVDNARKVLGLDTLNTKPTQFSLPERKQNIAGAGLQGMVETQPKQSDAPSSTTADQSFADYMGALMGQTTETSAASQAYKEQGVNDLQQKLDSYDTQLEMEQNALRNKQKRIQENSAGMSTQAIQDELNRAESESLWKQANISVVRSGVARDFSRAKAIADSAVEMQMEQQKNAIEARKLAYERNQGLFDKAEQRAFDAKIKEDERKYQEERAQLQEISDISLLVQEKGADGALVSSIRSAKTVAEAQSIASSFLSPIIQNERSLDTQYRQAQIYGAQLDNKLTQAKIQELNQQNTGQGVAFSENGVQIQPTAPPKAPTVAEQQSLVFFTRMKEAVDNLDNIETSIRSLGLFDQVQLNYAPSWMQTQDQQQYTQAARQFTEARLRKDSGAAIPDSEFANDRKMYFPQPGDTVETLEQKRIARNTALGSIRQASGNAYWELYGESPTDVSRKIQSDTNEYNNLVKNASPEQLRMLGLSAAMQKEK